MFVGGEFYYDSSWQVNTSVVDTSHLTFLNGGKACLIVIGDYLRAHGINEILLPSYLCPSILNTLEKHGLGCDFYPVQPDLTIDLEEMARKAEGHRAVYFIHYFGFPREPAELDLLRSLQAGGTLLIEDNAQCGFSPTVCGDFAFNSMRKLCAYDGGYLDSRFDLLPYIEKRAGLKNRRLPLIRDYRSRLADYLFNSKGDRNELQQLYELAENHYESDEVVEGDIVERHHIEHLDWDGIRKKRRDNYRYLVSLVEGLPGITPIFPILPQGVTPLSLPVYVNIPSRDQLVDALGDAGIGLTIHWEGLVRDPRVSGNTAVVDMASRMLSLVIDQRFSHKHMDYQAQTLTEWVNRHQSPSYPRA